MGDGFEIQWAVLPTWRGRYPRRYLVLVGVGACLAIALVGAVLGGAWAILAIGAALGAWVGVAVAVRRVEVRAGKITGLARGGAAISCNQILSVEPYRGAVVDGVEITVIGLDRAVRVGSLVSWRVWPDPRFPDEIRHFRAALGMSPDPVRGVGPGR